MRAELLSSPGTDVAAEIASVSRLVARAGLCEGFGHVSARAGADAFAITTTGPLARSHPREILRLPVDADPPATARGMPLEVPLHAAIYARRPDVGAIVRAHPPACVAAGAMGAVPPVAHGLGGLSGSVKLHDESQLVVSRERGRAAASALADGDCLVIRGNGMLATGAGLPEAAVRAYYLEERARVWMAAGRPDGLAEAELSERSRHWPVEATRAWFWLRSTYGEEGSG